MDARVVTRTRAAEQSVEAVAGTAVLFRRGGHLWLDGRDVTPGRGVVAAGGGRLALLGDGTRVIAYLQRGERSGCTSLLVRTLKGGRLGPASRVAVCASF